MRRKSIWLILLAILLIIGWFIYKTLFPGGPILDELPNPIQDMSAGIEDELNIATDPLKQAYFGDLHIHTGMSC